VFNVNPLPLADYQGDDLTRSVLPTRRQGCTPNEKMDTNRYEIPATC
jgi:hypothetical protein